MSMLPSFEIKNFRTFDHLVIDKFAQINLITGMNGVGKTSLLEAITLLKYKGQINCIRSIVDKERQEEIINHLFYGYEFPLNNKSDNTNGSKITIKALNPAREIFSDDEEGPLFIYKEKDANLHTESIFIKYINDESLWSLYIGKGNHSTHSMIYEENPREEYFNCYNIQAEGIAQKVMDDRWNKISLTQKEEQLIDGLKLINANIERIAPSLNSLNNTSEFMVKIRGFNKPASIKSLGDGTYKLFQIILTIINAENGTILIDEIENGLHYSVQPDVWKLIFTLAKRLNVQVFATTHSWDCIEAFQKASSEHEDVDCELIRLTKVKEHFRSTIFEKSELEIITQESIEVR